MCTPLAVLDTCELFTELKKNGGGGEEKNQTSALQ